MIQNPPKFEQAFAAEATPERQIDIRQYLAVLLKYKWAILSVALLTGLIGLYMALKAVPIYASQARLQVERDTSTQVLNNPLGMGIYNYEFYETQYQLMRSWGVAELAAAKLGMLDVPEQTTVQANAGMFGWRNWLPASLQAPPRTLTADEMRANRIASVKGAIRVQPVENSQLVGISIQNANPERAANMANAVAEAYIEFLKDKNLENLQTDQTWYSSRLETARDDLDRANQELQDFYERQDLLRGGTNEGGASLQSQRLQAALSNQGEAENTRLRLERVYRDIVNARNGQGSLENITELEPRGVVRALKASMIEARQAVTTLQQRYGPKHPRMINAQSRLENAQAEYRTELDRVAESVVADYRRAQSAEATYTSQVEQAKTEIRTLDRNLAEQQKLQDRVQTAKAIFERLQSGEATTGMLGSGSQKPNVTIIEYARPSLTPVRPNKQRMVMIAVVMGLMLGVGLAFLLDHLDNTFKNPEDVESKLGLPVLGSLPKLKLEKDDALRPMREFKEQHKSAFSESIRTIRTGAMLSGLDRDHNVIMVTSSVPGEGKTTLSLNLAYAIGQMKKTLLIDADMRRPMVGKAQETAKTQPGLAGFVSGEHSFEECVTRSETADLTIMHAGTVPPNPLELLASKRFEKLIEELRSEYQYIILDCAPALAVSDALVVSRLSDALLYLVRADATPFQAAEEGVRRLRRAEAPILGVVLNHVQARGRGYYGKYYRYGYRYRYGYYNTNYYHDYYGQDQKS
ncbi:MAG: polysaccharide biosynthesis tyrosine autokinase [Xanthomonadales bacterium]|nr:polysaccharide biosynthesis tyrosine autokinase [Xanthomonadales bacterium]